jgi:hypothetical protein
MPDADQLQGLRAQWKLNPETQPVFANLLLPQFGAPSMGISVPDTVYLSFGHMNPPTFDLEPGATPGPEDLAKLVVPISPVAQVVTSVDRLREFAAQLNNLLHEFDSNTGRA